MGLTLVPGSPGDDNDKWLLAQVQHFFCEIVSVTSQSQPHFPAASSRTLKKFPQGNKAWLFLSLPALPPPCPPPPVPSLQDGESWLGLLGPSPYQLYQEFEDLMTEVCPFDLRCTVWILALCIFFSPQDLNTCGLDDWHMTTL